MNSNGKAIISDDPIVKKPNGKDVFSSAKVHKVVSAVSSAVPIQPSGKNTAVSSVKVDKVRSSAKVDKVLFFRDVSFGIQVGELRFRLIHFWEARNVLTKTLIGLKMLLIDEQAEHCADVEVIYKFLEVNDIGKTHALYYIAYALHMERKSKVKTANEIFNLGISRNAKPVEKLNDAYKKFMVRTMRRPNTADEEPKENNDMPSRSFCTVLFRVDNNNAGRQALGPQAKKLKPNQSSKTPLSIYIDNTSGNHQESDKSKPEYGSWLMLGGRAKRNKENNAFPGKWKTFKVPQKPIVRTPAASASSFEVFVDEEEEECTK